MTGISIKSSSLFFVLFCQCKLSMCFSKLLDVVSAILFKKIEKVIFGIADKTKNTYTSTCCTFHSFIIKFKFALFSSYYFLDFHEHD